MAIPAPSTNASIPVAVVQMNSRGDKAANVATALALIDRAAGTGARLICLPETWTFLGDDDGARANAEPIPGPVTDQLSAKARQHGVYLHAGSIHEQVAGDPRVRNTTVVIAPDGEIVARYSKIHMFDVALEGGEAYRESSVVAPGDEIVTFDMDGVTVGLAICYDLRFPELFRILALRGAEVVVLPAAFTMRTGKDHWEVLIRARAIENQVFMLAPGQHGTYDDAHWCFGRSTIVDPWGVVLATAQDADTVITATLDMGRLTAVRRQVPSLANRMPDRYAWPDPATITSR